MKILALLLALLCTGCASYVTPGGPVNLADIDRADIAAAALKPGQSLGKLLTAAATTWTGIARQYQ